MTRRETAEKPAAGGSGHALWFDAPHHCALKRETIAAEGEGQVLVRTLFTGISRGTESLVFGGSVPQSEYERMRAPHQAGEFPFPVKYGYAAVGIVEEGPERLAGRTIFCLHPHQDRFRVPASAVHVLPESLPPQRAVLAANMETALNIVWDAGIQPGDRVAVFGAGVVGLIVARLAASVIGTDVVISDIEQERAEIAAALGLQFAAPDAVPGPGVPLPDSDPRRSPPKPKAPAPQPAAIPQAANALPGQHVAPLPPPIEIRPAPGVKSSRPRAPLVIAPPVPNTGRPGF